MTRHARCARMTDPVRQDTTNVAPRGDRGEEMEEGTGGIEPLHPMLREAHQKLEEALNEACAARPASDETTGEMIRLEETLSVAAEAAKRAVSIRRRLREEAERDRRARPDVRSERRGDGEDQARADG